MDGNIELAGALNGTLDLEGELNGSIQVPKEGYSPTVTITDITGGHRVTITDEDGDHVFDVLDGEDGQDGTDGVSPTISIDTVSGGHEITISDATGFHTFTVADGEDGSSATIQVSTITGGHRLTIRDASGTHTVDVMDGEDGADGGTPTVAKENVYQSWSGPAGSSLSSERTGFYLTITDADGNETTTGNIMEAWPVLIKASKSGGVTTVKFYTDSYTEDATLTINDGQDGAQGPAGPGVPTGGTTGQVLKKKSGTNYDTEWADESGGGGTTEIFIATTYSTTFSDIAAAISAGKVCLCHDGEDELFAQMVRKTNNYIEFITTCDFSSWPTVMKIYTVTSSDVWSTSDAPLIPAPANPSIGNYLKYNGSAWAADNGPSVPSAATATPSDLGTAAVGSSSKYAKEDHVHKKPTAADLGVIAAPSSPSNGNVLTYNGSAWVAAAPSGGTTEVAWVTYGTTQNSEIETAYQAGKLVACKYNGYVYTLVYRESSTSHGFAAVVDDTAHYIKCSSNTWAADSTATIPLAASSNPQNLGTAAKGTSTRYARQDHVHKMPSASDVGAIAAPASPSNGDYLKYNGSAWAAGSGPSVPSAYTSTPEMDGTASAGSSSDYAKGDHVHPTDTSRAAATDLANKADKITEVTVSTAGAVTQALDAGKIYHFTGALTSLTITLNAAASGQLAHYHFDFDCGSTAPTVTIPNTVTMPSGTFDASKHYEVDILNNYGAVLSWATS